MKIPGTVKGVKVPDLRESILTTDMKRFYQTREEWDEILTIRRSSKGITVITRNGSDAWRMTADGWKCKPFPRLDRSIETGEIQCQKP